MVVGVLLLILHTGDGSRGKGCKLVYAGQGAGTVRQWRVLVLLVSNNEPYQVPIDRGEFTMTSD